MWTFSFGGKVTAELDEWGDWTVQGDTSLWAVLENDFNVKNVSTDVPDRFAFIAERVADELGARITKRGERKRVKERYFEPIL